MGGINIWNLLIIALLVVLLFGTKKLRTLGGDLGESIKGFKKAMKDENKDAGFEQVEQKQAESTTEKSKEKEQA